MGTKRTAYIISTTTSGSLTSDGMLPRALSGLKFGKFSVPNGTVHSGCTDPTRTTARLVIVLVSWMQKRDTGDNNFVK